MPEVLVEGRVKLQGNLIYLSKLNYSLIFLLDFS